MTLLVVQHLVETEQTDCLGKRGRPLPTVRYDQPTRRYNDQGPDTLVSGARPKPGAHDVERPPPADRHWISRLGCCT